MTDVNHRRTNRAPVDRRYPSAHYHNGYARQDGTERDRSGTIIDRDERNVNGRVGGTGYLDKSMHGWGDEGAISGHRVSASIGNDFTNGHRGMARAVAGAKKFVRTRIRHHENAATRRLAAQAADDAADEALDAGLDGDFHDIQIALEDEFGHDDNVFEARA